MGQIWLGRFMNLMTLTQPEPLLKKKKFITQPNPPILKNRPNPAGLPHTPLGIFNRIKKKILFKSTF